MDVKLNTFNSGITPIITEKDREELSMLKAGLADVCPQMPEADVEKTARKMLLVSMKKFHEWKVARARVPMALNLLCWIGFSAGAALATIRLKYFPHNDSLVDLTLALFVGSFSCLVLGGVLGCCDEVRGVPREAKKSRKIVQILDEGIKALA